MPHPLLAYISHGQLHLQGDDSGEVLESPFGRSLRERAIQISHRNAWKTQGRGGQSLSRALRMPPPANPADFQLTMTSVARGIRPGEMLYTLETDEISGVFARDGEGLEKRLFHTADFRASQPAMHPGGKEIAISVRHSPVMANLAVMNGDGSSLTEVTDGESLDEAPRWIPGPGRRLVFQSAGAGRDRKGRLSGKGSTGVHRIDLDSGEMSCLVEDSSFDFLSPQMAADGTLYYIRKPNEHARGQSRSPRQSAGRTIGLISQMFFLLAKLIEMRVAMRTGRPLPDLEPENKTAAKASPTWLLMRHRDGAQAETIAQGAQSFDIGSDGSLLYSDGVSVYRVPENGGPAAKVLSGVPVDLLAAL